MRLNDLPSLFSNDWLGWASWWVRSRSFLQWTFLFACLAGVGFPLLAEFWWLPALDRQIELARNEAGQPASIHAAGVDARADRRDLSVHSNPEAGPAVLAPPDSINDVWVLTHLLAANHGVKLDKGEYRYVSPQHAAVASYEMSLPLQGDYVNVRAFLAALLAEQPGLALDGISFSRNRASDAEISVTAKVTLFLKPDPA